MLSCHFRLLATHIVSKCSAAWRPALSAWMAAGKAGMKLMDRKIMRNCSDSRAKLGAVIACLSLSSSSPRLPVYFCYAPKDFTTRSGFKQSREKHINGSGISLGVNCEAAVALTHNSHSFILSTLNHYSISIIPWWNLIQCVESCPLTAKPHCCDFLSQTTAWRMSVISKLSSLGNYGGTHTAGKSAVGKN